MKNFKNIICGIITMFTIMITCIACDNIENVNVEDTTNVTTESNTETISETETETNTEVETETISETETNIEIETEVEVVEAETILAAKSVSKKVSKKSNREIAKEVVIGKWGNGEVRKTKLKKAGYEYRPIQNIVNDMMAEINKEAVKTVSERNTTSKKTTKNSSKKKVNTVTESTNPVTTTVAEVENETIETTVISETEEVQTTVIETEVAETTTEAKVTKSNDEIAQEVLDGKWGNGAERKRKLTEAGYDYAAIQKVVAEKLKEINAKKTEETGTTDSTASTGSTTYVGHFTGTYYAYGGARHGGSGRNLIDCSYGDGNVKGSIACRAIYANYGYNKNGRTMVYLEVNGYPQMNGYYYVDDCCGSYNVIDFFYIYNSNCPFQYAGVTGVDCYIVN